MKKTSTFLLIILVSFTMSSFGQLKVDQYGRIGMGTNYPNSEFKCHIAGNLLLSSYPSNPFYELRMKVNNGWPGVEVGSNWDAIAFWATGVDFNDVYAAHYLIGSDIRLKTNIVNIKSGLSKVMQIRPVFYNIEDNKFDSTGKLFEKRKPQYGFISQEIEKTLPEVDITEDIKDTKLMDYNQIIPLTVAAIQEQQLIIDSLKNEIKNLSTIIARANLKLYEKNSESTTKNNDGNKLYQNNPNPFNQKTEISFTISKQNFESASIIVFDMNGVFIKRIEIQQAGQGSIEINANELKAGMYIYTLLVNEKEVDTKRMILLN